MSMNGPYTIGIDLGQVSDPTAIVAVQSLARDDGKPIYWVTHIERLPLGLTYPGVISHVKRLLHQRRFSSAKLVLDLTGLGRPVADHFNDEGLHPLKVTITGGATEHRDEKGVWSVPKHILVAAVRTPLESERLFFDKSQPEAPILQAELKNFRAEYSDSGRIAYNARVGAHDDLVLACALAAWWAARHNSMRIDPAVVHRSAQIVSRPGVDVTGGLRNGPRDPYEAGWPYPLRR
jgi:hypothetical protein